MDESNDFKLIIRYIIDKQEASIVRLSEELKDSLKDVYKTMATNASSAQDFTIKAFMILGAFVSAVYSYSYLEDKDIVRDIKESKHEINKHLIECGARAADADKEHEFLERIITKGK